MHMPAARPDETAVDARAPIRTAVTPRTTILVFLLLLLVVAAVQWRGGVHLAEFSGHPDEPAHYVTGLMIRDYVVDGLPAPPLTFAENYYNHYPKVALGNWPPVFYVIQAGWALIFSPAKTSILLMMAALTALVGAIIWYTLGREFGVLAGLAGALLWVSFPLVQQSAAMVMTEVPVTLFSLLAVLAFGRYVDRAQPRDSVLFGVLASAAILTKGSGLILALIPPFAILITGKFGLLKRPSLYAAVAMVLLLAGPWTYLFRDVARAGWQDPTVSVDYTRRALTEFPRILLERQGILTAMFAAVGLLTILVWTRRRTEGGGRWASVAALIPAVLIFHCIVPASLDSRHMVQALPALAMLAVAGTVWIHERLNNAGPVLRWAPATVLVLGGVSAALPLVQKPGRGFEAVVAAVVEQPEHRQDRILISSDATGEGMFVAETAMQDQRPQHIVRRASKLLANQAWHGGEYEMTVTDAAGVVSLLQNEGIRVVVVDTSVPHGWQAAHHALLRVAIDSRPDTFALRGRYTITRGYPYRRAVEYPGGIEVYQVAPAQNAAPTAGR